MEGESDKWQQKCDEDVALNIPLIGAEHEGPNNNVTTSLLKTCFNGLNALSGQRNRRGSFRSSAISPPTIYIHAPSPIMLSVSGVFLSLISDVVSKPPLRSDGPPTIMFLIRSSTSIAVRQAH
ncbi:hypothetical protein TSUD_169840 [Trifolium subterraneum]|nr:hypothetical protein TSUD_169840 [Trifolium subterraneum]